MPGLLKSCASTILIIYNIFIHCWPNTYSLSNAQLKFHTPHLPLTLTQIIKNFILMAVCFYLNT